MEPIAEHEQKGNLFAVDPDKCKHDGICVSECPVQIIELKDRKSLPELIPGGAEFCINCGHCVSVCPHGAMSLKTMPLEHCPPLDRALLPGPQQVDHLLRSRRSSRVYRDDPIDRKIVASLIDIARYAPSGHNFQPVRWLVIQEKNELKRLAGIVIDWMRLTIVNDEPIAQILHFDRAVEVWDRGTDRILRDAPCLVVAFGRSDVSASQSACISARTYLELAAYSYGLGACWAGYFNAAANFYKPMQDALSLPEGHQSFGAMMIGYAKNKYHRVPMRNEAKIEWR